MRANKKWLCLLTICVAFGISGCNNSENVQENVTVEGLDELGEIQVISREDGSGTRSAFAQLVGFDGTSEDGGQSDQTTSDAQITNNAEEVIAAVEEGTSAIGYVSEGALGETQDVKSLSVGNGSLSRSFYLAYTGELNDLEQDFLTYVHSEGQGIVEKSYASVAKSSTFLSNKASGEISIKGSTSVAPLMQELAEAYMQINPEAVVTVEETDSTDGLTQAMEQTCDFGMASRDLKDYEKELLDYEMIAQDDIAVIVSKDNPLEDISLDSLKEIYTGEIKNWSDLNQQ
ncbi:MAG: hypothetical protein EOM40_10390 [Clostridia bacterium]|nr:hypothetical protein [Clostridia bacterium]NCC43766.1 hypothetical protein [Clostridia bacterium]